MPTKCLESVWGACAPRALKDPPLSRSTFYKGNPKICSVTSGPSGVNLMTQILGSVCICHLVVIPAHMHMPMFQSVNESLHVHVFSSVCFLSV